MDGGLLEIFAEAIFHGLTLRKAAVKVRDRRLGVFRFGLRP